MDKPRPAGLHVRDACATGTAKGARESAARRQPSPAFGRRTETGMTTGEPTAGGAVRGVWTPEAGRRSIRLAGRAVSFAAFVVLALSTAAPAALCGDDVAGRRVACGCGDTVVSTTTLRASDPVVTSVCGADGLVVRSGDGGPVVLDLSGFTLSGSRVGVGIRVLDGGEGGAVVRGGSVSGFAVGVKAGARGARARVERLYTGDNKTDGLAVRGETELSAVVSERNGRDGVRVHGRDVAGRDVQAAGNGRAAVADRTHRTGRAE